MNALAGLMNPAAIGQQVQQSFDAGQQRRVESETRNALGALVTNPDDPEAMANLARNNPQAAMAMQERQAQQRAAAEKAQRDEQTRFFETVPQMAKLLEYGAQGPEQYAQALAMGRQMGLPGIDQAPQQFDPNWLQSNLAITRALAQGGPDLLTNTAKETMLSLPPEQRDVNNPAFIAAFNQRLAASDSKVVSYQPGGGAARIDRDGTVTPLIIPNPGNAPAGAPAGGDGIPPEAIEALRRGEGTPEQFDQMFGTGAAAKAMGGTASNGGGGF